MDPMRPLRDVDQHAIIVQRLSQLPEEILHHHVRWFVINVGVNQDSTAILKAFVSPVLNV